MTEQTIFRNAKLADGSLADLHVVDGRFSAIMGISSKYRRLGPLNCVSSTPSCLAFH